MFEKYYNLFNMRIINVFSPIKPKIKTKVQRIDFFLFLKMKG